jgi:hypothetical protein
LIWIKLTTNLLNTRNDQGNGFWKELRLELRRRCRSMFHFHLQGRGTRTFK